MSRLDQFRKEHGQPSERAQSKVVPFMEEHVRKFISEAPFAVLSTSDVNGNCDASPRGGNPGFVKIIDDRTLLIPDIAGNRLFHSYQNIESNPKAALVFFIPNNDKCVRVNGRVEILNKAELDKLQLTPEVNYFDDKTIVIQAIRLTVDEAYSHCPRALKFSNLWAK